MDNGTAVKTFLVSIVNMLKDIIVPGFAFSFFDLLIGIFVVGLSITIVRLLFGFTSTD